MALLPYLLDNEVRPRRLQDQLFGLDLADTFISDLLKRPLRHPRHWMNLPALQRDVGSTIKSDKDKFQVNLDVQHFSPEDISVKTADNYIIVEGKHEEKEDEHGFVSRQFKRRYALPDGCNPEMVESRLSSDGVLTVTAPKTCGGTDERNIAITHTGPVRRKIAEDQAQKDPEEVKTPQKKKKR